ncbi:MAG: DNA replication/repair protein RecF [Bergeyella sp.]|nr:DNA replication/repair protein RecF [Bergeyella sp.]
MRVNDLSVTHFKNHKEQYFLFSPEINCFVGNNGVGKTNLLDALHYLSMAKSFLGNRDVSNICFNEDFFAIEGKVISNEKEDLIKIIQTKENGKVLKKNDKKYNKLSDHIGYLPSVMISPYDYNLISDSAESRRRFLDYMISQTDPEYLYHIIQYQKVLLQRNSLLKYFAKNRIFDKDSLSIYDEPMNTFGQKIFEKRTIFTQQLSPLVQKFYKWISEDKESITVQYKSHLAEKNMHQLLEESLAKDKLLTFTTKGIHKDDMNFEMNKHPIKKTGSQGQQKSFLIALKLAQISKIKDITRKSPILLLDDIFDKLDDLRVSKLIQLITEQNFGQIFITDTHRERTEKLVKSISEKSVVFEL